ncbi:hypothetical protein ACIMOF_04150 [Escherichia coli]
MEFSFRRSNRTIARPELFRNDKPWMVFWYRGFVPNPSLTNQPRIATEFRQLGRNGEVLTVYDQINILVSDLSFFTLGSVWQNGVCIQESQLQEKVFSLDYGKGWRFRNFQDETTFPADFYKPDRLNLQESWVIEFDLANGGRLLVPCIEFFSRCYGYSGEVKRVLTTYPWAECLERLYAFNEKPEEPGKWQICLPRQIPETDAIMLATAKYRPQSQKALSSIYATLSTQFFNQRTPGKPVPVKIGPWHSQEAQLMVAGIPFGALSFLGLRIIGVSEPEGPPVNISHQQGDKSENPAPPGSELAFDGARSTLRIQVPDSVVVTGFTEPDSGMQRVEVETPSLRILGKRRKVHKVISPEARYGSGKALPGESASTFSPGSAGKNDQLVGELSVQTRGNNVLDSEGVVRDFWNALILLKDTRPELIQSVEWYTPERGFSASPHPEYIAFEPGHSATAIYNWCHTDVNQGMKRGVLFIRIRFPEKTAYVAEIERRPSRNKDENAHEDDSFRGVIFTPDQETDVHQWIKTFMEKAPPVSGRVVRFIGEMPGPAYPFKHTLAKNAPHPGFTAVRNAFKKIGLSISM